ncbi:MAG: hypothetical protein QNJ37_04705 [Crocosphaera sp.]|nr:hypothetical protein [Crocosphaera sp.]
MINLLLYLPVIAIAISFFEFLKKEEIKRQEEMLLQQLLEQHQNSLMMQEFRKVGNCFRQSNCQLF